MINYRLASSENISLLTSSIVLALLCGPARADTKPATPPPASSMRVKVKIADGAEQRTYELWLTNDGCSMVEERSGDRLDEVKLCARDAPNGVRLGATWKLRAKLIEHSSSFEAVVAKGKSVEVGREKGARLTLTVI
jgi:hypothetical protein